MLSLPLCSVDEKGNVRHVSIDTQTVISVVLTQCLLLSTHSHNPY